MASRTEGEALAYVADGTLATVAQMTLKSSRVKSEYARQISIAQTSVDLMCRFGTDFSHTRAHDVVMNFRGSVEAWAKSMDPENAENICSTFRLRSL